MKESTTIKEPGLNWLNVARDENLPKGVVAAELSQEIAKCKDEWLPMEKYFLEDPDWLSASILHRLNLLPLEHQKELMELISKSRGQEKE